MNIFDRIGKKVQEWGRVFASTTEYIFETLGAKIEVTLADWWNGLIENLESVIGSWKWTNALKIDVSEETRAKAEDAGRKIGAAITHGIAATAKVPQIKGEILAKNNGATTKNTFTVSAMTFANGGFPQGSTFIAGEVPGEYEFVGDINGRTGVVSGAEISGIADAIRAEHADVVSVLTRIAGYTAETASKDYNPTVSVTDINNAQSRNNRRLGTTVAALAY